MKSICKLALLLVETHFGGLAMDLSWERLVLTSLSVLSIAGFKGLLARQTAMHFVRVDRQSAKFCVIFVGRMWR